MDGRTLAFFFLLKVAEPRMAPLAIKATFQGPSEKGKHYALVDPILLEEFFDFCSRFAFGRHHMWLGERCISPDAPFIHDALRPGIDLGYHLQHRLPRKQLQGETALAASSLKTQLAELQTANVVLSRPLAARIVESLTELGPFRHRTSGGANLHQPWENPAYDELRMMKKTTRKPGAVAPSFASTAPTAANPQSPPWRNGETKDAEHALSDVSETKTVTHSRSDVNDAKHTGHSSSDLSE